MDGLGFAGSMLGTLDTLLRMGFLLYVYLYIKKEKVLFSSYRIAG